MEGEAGTWNELPLRKDDGTTGISPHSHIAASTTYGEFLANFRPGRDHLYKAVPVDERTGSKVYDENAKDRGDLASLRREDTAAGGSMINGVAPGEPDDASRWSVPVVRAAFSRAVDKSRQDSFDEGYVTSDKEEGWATDEEAEATKMGIVRKEKDAKAAPRTGPRPTYVEPPPLTAPLSRVWADMLRRNDVAIKFGCPAKAAADRRSRPESASIEAANDWRSSAEAIERRILDEARVYTSKLQSVQGIYAPAFYGLWSFELAEGRVYMMVLEQLHPLKQEGIDLARPVQPLWVQ
ncbi:uncharacterized protein MKK02DRAFT_39178 [Dioszegia hungarica]|uniref:Uncharacterized protein n=1 Tax=Dioszegia hungarica TaxID=4972 RepID=A0AA38H617_9TREE|nr:uncharacterized protein MKK02DRAFT_39178 [Dioszegia hungarica]KAI9633199.1 hypothetical protein MKK02DRAFT_39178 [Dioszegia hungarica]